MPFLPPRGFDMLSDEWKMKRSLYGTCIFFLQIALIYFSANSEFSQIKDQQLTNKRLLQ